MAKKKTALQMAQDRGRAGIDPVRLGVTVAIGALLSLGIACLMQALAVVREESAAAGLLEARQRVLATASKFVATQQNLLHQALDDEEIRLALVTVDDAARQRADLRLKQRLSSALNAEFFAADLPELISADLATFGYARANILADARGSKSGEARAQAHKDGEGKWRLALSQAVSSGDHVLAFAYVLLPVDGLLDPLHAERLSGGNLKIRQGVYGGSILDQVVGSSAGNTAEEQSVSVPRSIFTLATQRAEMFKIGDFLPLVDFRATGRLSVLGVLMLMAAGVLIYVLRLLPAPGASRADAGSPEAVAEGLKEKLARMVGKGAEQKSAAPQAPPDQPVAVAATANVPTTRPAPAAEAPRASGVDRSIFRAYDIRGVVGKTLTNATARAIGQAVGSAVQEKGLREVVVARDGRLSGPQLVAELIKGLRSTGCDVIDIGQVPTPVLYFATYHLNAGSGVMVTGSHNPPDYNGFKIMVGGETLAEEAISDLYARIAEGRFSTGSGGLQTMDVSTDYIERITGDVQVERKLKVVVDAGNGVAGVIGPQVLEGIGCEVVPLYCDIDGNFPNHHPDPSDPHNLHDLIMSVKQMKADLGFAFDGDGDRLGVVTATGEIIYPDRLLMLFAIDVLNRNPGAAIIYDVKCTGHLQDVILRHGGSPMMWKTGHSLIKAKMREEDAELAGEMSGHFFFRERWFGFDDGIYAAARLAEIIGASDRSAQDVFDDLPKGVSTPELKIAMEEGAHFAFIAKFRERAAFPGARISTIDGVRADFSDGWGLVRCSNTTPNLVLRFDADNQAALNRIQDAFRSQLLALEPALKLPF